MQSTWILRLSATLLVLFIAVASVGAIAHTSPRSPAATPTSPLAIATAQPTLVPAATPEPTGQVQTAPFIRSELFFGSERPNQPEVSDAEFKRFLDTVVTPRFPDGLTVLKGYGQFREASGAIVQESSFVLVLLYPEDARRDRSTKIEAIRAEYLTQFGQESVLRVDDPRPVQVAF